MKTILKRILTNYLSLFIITQVIGNGFIINNGFIGYTKAVLVLSFIYPLFKLVGKIILLPLNFLTLGFINFVLNFVLIYLFTIVVNDISVFDVTIKNTYLMLFNLEYFQLSKFGTIAVVSVMLSVFQKFFLWIMS